MGAVGGSGNPGDWRGQRYERNRSVRWTAQVALRQRAVGPQGQQNSP